MAAWGRRLAAARLAAGFETAADMARELGMVINTYRRYERGETVPPLDVLDNIRKLTSKPLDWLLVGVSEQPQLLAQRKSDDIDKGDAEG